MNSLVRTRILLLAGLFLFLLKILYAILPVLHTFDEGVYWESLRFMAEGLHPYKDFFHAQFPGFLKITNFFYSLSGGSLAFTRASLAFASCGGVLSAYVIGRNLRSHRFGLALALLLGTDSLFFHVSYHLNGDALALTLFLASFALATFPQSKLWHWALSAIFAALSLMVKPITAPLFASFLFLFFPLTKERVRAVLVWGAFCLASIFLVLWFSDWPQHGFAQLQGGHFAGKRFVSSSTFARLTTLVNPATMYPVGNVLVLPFFLWALWAAAKKFPPLFRATCVVFVAALAALLLHNNVNWYHFVLLSPLLALPPAYLAAESPRFPSWLWLMVGVNVAFNVAPYFFPTAETLEDRARRQELVEVIRQNSQEQDLVVSDDAYLVAASGRRGSPMLVDLSWARIEAASVTCASLETAIAAERPKLFVVGKRITMIDCGREELVRRAQKHMPRVVFERKNTTVLAAP